MLWSSPLSFIVTDDALVPMEAMDSSSWPPPTDGSGENRAPPLKFMNREGDSMPSSAVRCAVGDRKGAMSAGDIRPGMDALLTVRWDFLPRDPALAVMGGGENRPVVTSGGGTAAEAAAACDVVFVAWEPVSEKAGGAVEGSVNGVASEGRGCRPCEPPIADMPLAGGGGVGSALLTSRPRRAEARRVPSAGDAAAAAAGTGELRPCNMDDAALMSAVWRRRRDVDGAPSIMLAAAVGDMMLSVMGVSAGRGSPKRDGVAGGM